MEIRCPFLVALPCYHLLNASNLETAYCVFDKGQHRGEEDGNAVTAALPECKFAPATLAKIRWIFLSCWFLRHSPPWLNIKIWPQRALSWDSCLKFRGSVNLDGENLPFPPLWMQAGKEGCQHPGRCPVEHRCLHQGHCGNWERAHHICAGFLFHSFRIFVYFGHFYLLIF